MSTTQALDVSSCPDSRPSTSSTSFTDDKTIVTSEHTDNLTLEISVPMSDSEAAPPPSPRSYPSSIAATAVSDESQPVKAWPISTFRLWIAHIGLALTLFLATTDATIVSTSLPTITSNLHASPSQYTWVGVSYMLTQTASQPLYGKISDLVGRKTILYASMAIFVIGSLLCGSAQDIVWLIASRALAGVGGGGIVACVWVITAEIVPIQARAKWSQALSVTWSCSAIAGPLLGGFFSDDTYSGLSWRWAFYLNIPVCFVALIVLLISLRNVELSRSESASWRALGQKFDFIGLSLFMAGTSSLLVGFSFASQNGWISPSTLTLIICGIAVLVCGGIYETRTTREALFPRIIFTNLTTSIILLITFLHNFAFNAGTFYLALYFQAANGSTPLQAGVLMLPYSLGSSLASMPAAWFIGLWQKKSRTTSGQKWVICIGLLISALGFGLLNMLRAQSPSSLQIVFPLLAGIGLGFLFHAPYQVFTGALRPSEIATGTSAFFLVRFTGATTGLAVAGAVFYSRLYHNLPAGYQLPGSSASIDWKALASIQPVPLRNEIIQVVSSSIRTVWTLCTPCLAVAFLISLFLANVAIEPMDTAISSMSETKISVVRDPSLKSEV